MPNKMVCAPNRLLQIIRCFFKSKWKWINQYWDFFRKILRGVCVSDALVWSKTSFDDYFYLQWHFLNVINTRIKKNSLVLFSLSFFHKVPKPEGYQTFSGQYGLVFPVLLLWQGTLLSSYPMCALKNSTLRHKHRINQAWLSNQHSGSLN